MPGIRHGQFVAVDIDHATEHRGEVAVLTDMKHGRKGVEDGCW